MTTLKLLLATDYGLMSVGVIVLVVGFGIYAALKPRGTPGPGQREQTQP